MEKQVLKVNGMSCNHCKMAVEKALKEIGVKADVSLEAKTVTIEYDAKSVTMDKIIAQIEDEGYEVVR